MKQKLKHLAQFRKTNLLTIFVLILIFGLPLFIQHNSYISVPQIFQKKIKQLPPQEFDFSTLEESGSINDSKSQNWWLNSGGLIYNENGTLKTIQGELDPKNIWFEKYKQSTPQETDLGRHPQNIFRLVNKNNFQNYAQQAYFKINKTIMSRSPNRNESNGLLFFNRYLDGDNLYYTGIRVDGTSIIKKKKDGTYYTMAQNPLFEGTYNRESAPNLLPLNTWIGLRSEVTNTSQNEVQIRLYIDRNQTQNWELIAESIDDSSQFGGDAFLTPAHIGIRTDFMDIEFKEYKVTNL